MELDVGVLKQDGDDAIELRCTGTLQGIIREHQGVQRLETKCHHIRCTKGKAVSIFHYFSLQTGELVDTVEYKDPGKRFK